MREMGNMGSVTGATLWMLFGWTVGAFGQVGLLVNPSFEQGQKTPLGWSAPRGHGEWLKTNGVDGAACIRIDGNGTGDGAWVSEPVKFQPGRTYRFGFDARADDASGGTAVSGPTFANRDIGVPGKTWARHEYVFAAPSSTAGATAPIRLGQWQMKGKLFFDGASLVPVQPVYASAEGLTLGAGEQLTGNKYAFDAPLGNECGNHSRPLADFDASFNSDRWCFGKTSIVTYRHELNGRRLLSGAIGITCNYYVNGTLFVEASTNAKDWQQVGSLSHPGTAKFDLPHTLFPARVVCVRMRSDASPCNLQVHGYAFHTAVDGNPLNLVGSTRYIEVEAMNPEVKVQVLGLGATIPGGGNAVALRARNESGTALKTEARVLLSRDGSPTHTNIVAVALPAGETLDLRAPYEIPGTGPWQMAVELGDAYAAKASILVPDYYDDTYGEIIPLNHPKLNLWCASSGWKIPRHRTLPRRVAKDIILRTAKNEWEALQVVITPNAALSNVVVRASELVSGESRIPAENVEVLRVGYVPVTKKTDKTGTLADWPDPLPPQAKPIHLAAGENQPYWIRVKAPKDAPAGLYRGTLTVEADGATLSTALHVEVYDFALPDAATCETSFGFSPNTVWRYQKVTDPEHRRAVLGKYLTSLSEHHISPYNPAPMDGWHVQWLGLNPWHGGTIVTNEHAEGRGALFVDDASDRQNVCVTYDRAVTLPPKGLKIAFKHKTDRPHRFLFSLNYQRADGIWIRGRNTDIAIDGKPAWQDFETTVSAFPHGATTCRFSLWAAGYQEPGVATGRLWVDALSITDAASGNPMIEGGDFEPIDAAKVTPVFDWEKWDTAMTRAFEQYHFNSFVIHIDGLGGGTFQGRSEPRFLGYAEDAPEYDILLGKYLKGIEGHLRDKGWLNRAYVYWFDEPDPKDYAFVMNGFAKLKKHAPGLRRMLTEQVETELVGGPNLWVPLTPSLNVEGTEERRRAGDQFWWYVCCGPKAPYATEFIDHPGTEMRVWPWQTWAERVTGVLIWETVYWTSPTAYPDGAHPQNPYLDPMSWVSSETLAPGTRNPWGNGDGRFMYPPEAAADGKPPAPVLDGPVDSIRLELLRDGIEDYEYFVILKRLLTKKASKVDPRERAKYEALLTVPADVSTDLTHFTHDPATIEAHRDKLARAIVELQKR